MSAARLAKALSALREAGSPGALRSSEMGALLESLGQPLKSSALFNFIKVLCDSGALEKFGQDVYLNRMRFPKAHAFEAVSMVRSNAVVGLRSVLGESGNLNNISGEISALLPFSKESRPSAQKFMGYNGHSISFRVLPERFFARDDESRELFMDKKRPYPCFNAEKCVVDWIYLSRSSASTMPALPFDFDPEGLDADKIVKIARALDVPLPFSDMAGFREYLKTAWTSVKGASGQGGQASEPVEAANSAAAAAKSRLMSKLRK